MVGEIVKLTEVKLKDISKNNRGYYGIGASAVDYDENKYTYLRITDINDDGTLNTTALMSVDDDNACEFLLKENDEAQMDNKKEDIGEEIQIEKTEKKYNINKLRDFDYLRKNFYRVDSTTSISKEQLDVDKLLNMDMSIDKKGNLPEILIYHTHSQEGYLKSGNYSEGNTVMEVGDYLEQILEEK